MQLTNTYSFNELSTEAQDTAREHYLDKMNVGDLDCMWFAESFLEELKQRGYVNPRFGHGNTIEFSMELEDYHKESDDNLSYEEWLKEKPHDLYRDYEIAWENEVTRQRSYDHMLEVFRDYCIEFDEEGHKI